ncbi:beta-1,3-galactosyltransferase 5-like [Paramuricea clavata]|uniref:Hexosyltransferase n=1 Tax=Paramuricea clavata TaxID=317549 RepID=A0A6S7KH00_PARCT|nr:beta-1,3-galactosyltransferase 5-like [Paramuricea clavata]
MNDPFELQITVTSIDLINDYYPFIDFKFVFPEISPKVRRTPDIFLMVLVNSGAMGDTFRKRREAVRQTWGNHSNCEQIKALGDETLKDLRWLLVFVVGKAGWGTNDDELNRAEARQYNDMLIGNITDNYLNNVIKLYMGLAWASRFDIKYILKTDDDVYVRIPRILEYLVNARFPKPFCGGAAERRSTKVIREIGDKWTISWKYYNETRYPRYNPGAFFILSSDLLNRLFNYVYIRKPFHVDDAYVGVAMRDLGVNVTKISSFLIQTKMNQRIRKANHCGILRLHAFGHNMEPESNRFLDNRLKALACGQKQIKCGVRVGNHSVSKKNKKSL